ncbi:MAG: hypothetical protein JSU06_00960 [Actinobacteria bacterium]|nr:hypothetical protein [Actinomycetota bacterium]
MKSISFSNVIALLALFIALGGSVYAASDKIDGSQIKAKSLPGNRLEPGSVTASQIKKGSIGEAQLKAGAITAKQIRSGTITGAQIQTGSISGSQIQNGSLGASQINQATLTGISAANIHTVQYVTATVAINPAAPLGGSGTATCPSGMKVIGGGAVLANAKEGYVNESGPNAERSGWFADAFSYENPLTMTITAICTPVAAPAG